MKFRTSIPVLLIGFSILLLMPSCKVWNNVFGPKYGCPSNGKNVGAEKLMGVEKAPKVKKFKA